MSHTELTVIFTHDFNVLNVMNVPLSGQSWKDNLTLALTVFLLLTREHVSQCLHVH